jgi:hypothetical protein
MSRRGFAAAIALIAALAVPVGAYLKLGTDVNGRTLTLQWRDFPIRYFISNTDAALVSAPQLQAAVGRGFATWHAVETARSSS